MFDWILSLLDAIAFSFISPIYCQSRHCGTANLLLAFFLIITIVKLIKNKKRRFYYFSFFPAITLSYKIYQFLFFNPPSGSDISFYSLCFETVSKYQLSLTVAVLLISIINIYLSASGKFKRNIQFFITIILILVSLSFNILALPLIGIE